MARTMADRLGQSRARLFIGRRPELDLFVGLVDAQGEAAVLALHGPAGIGKSTLVREFARCARQRGATCEVVDAREVPPTLDALELRLAPLLDPGMDSARAKTVLILDGYELLAEVDTGFRERLAPRLPADVVLVLAGHHPPSVGWRTDDGWAPLLRTLRLRNLSPEESGRYLDARHVPAELQPPAVAFTHGHPLALALVTEVARQKGALDPSDSANVIKVLLDRLLDAMPTAAHRAALEAAAQVRVVDEPLLAAMLDLPDVSDLFGWMRGLPVVDAGAHGLFLHDLARAVLAADLQWRHPDRHAVFHDRAREHYLARLNRPDPTSQAVALLDLIYLHPDLRNFLQAPEESAALRIEPALPSDRATIGAMIERHEGRESAELARSWLRRRPESWQVVRGTDSDVQGAVCMLPVETVGPDEDPAVGAARAELAEHPPLRPGETATLIRYWLARETYQSVSPPQSLLAAQFARHFLTTPGLAVTLMPFAQPEEWEAFCSYADQRRAPRADFTIGGRSYATFVHDWRIVPPAALVARLSQQEIGSPAAAPPPASAAALLVLAEPQFAAAVRQALRDYTRLDRLRSSPLLRCRLVTTRLSGNESPSRQAELLKVLIKEAAESLAVAPSDRRLHRVLVRAYLAPAPTLERAAEVLELPSSTFRRLLGSAVGRVTTLLWSQELES